MLQCCIALSNSIAETASSIERKYIYPLDLVDCCIGLVWELEELCGLSQAECHALVKCALLAHGCTEEEVSPFDKGSVDRGTIRAKKVAFAKRILDSVNAIAQVRQGNMRNNARSE